MNKAPVSNIRDAAAGRPQSRGIVAKVLGAGLLLVLIFTPLGGWVLPVLGHGLHLLLAVVETALGHVLVEAFDLSHRQAQAVLAYGGVGLGVFVLARALRQACAAAVRAWQAARAGLERARAARARVDWRAAAVLGMIGATLYWMA